MTITSALTAHWHWQNNLASITGVGQANLLKLQKLGLTCQGDLLLHLPIRYEDRTRIWPIRQSPIGEVVQIQGVIIEASETKKYKKQLTIKVEDQSGLMTLIFYHYYPNMLRQFKKGQLIRCYGQVRFYKYEKTLVHPDVACVSDDTPLSSHLSPVYTTVSGLSQAWWRKTMKGLLASLKKTHQVAAQLEETLNQYFGVDFVTALYHIHAPLPDCSLVSLQEKKHSAFQRIIADEWLAYRFCMDQQHAQQRQDTGMSMSIAKEVLDQAIQALPFALTQGQQQALLDIQSDMQKTTPMMRLLQGDVGSGKTVIALLSAVIALENQFQVAIMAPTEVLAEQLYQVFKKFFKDKPYQIGLLLGRLKPKEKRIIQQALESHQCHIVIGTHALFQDSIIFQSLGLVIIDEQHRFGVHQRLRLTTKGEAQAEKSVSIEETIKRQPHQLIMTATPIPRTLCMSCYHYLQTSQIKTMPSGRKPIQTVAISNKKRETIMARVMEHCQSGEQVYWVCPLVDESEQLEAQAAIAAYEQLKTQCHPLNVGLIHGKCAATEKEAVMNAFQCGDIQVLVATTVIEVGINVPNATLMVIENAERFGLAQLHQLRGRVGRGTQQSFCVLLYHPPLSRYAKDRLETMRQTTNGFEIAEKDLQLRGPGEVLGVRQSGMQSLKIANFMRDYHLIEQMNELLTQNQYDAKQQQSVIQRWFHTKSDYAKV